MFITAVPIIKHTHTPITKLFAGGGVGGEIGGHVLRETTSRGQCELVCPSRTNERGGEGYCVKGGREEEGERERERAGRLHYGLSVCTSIQSVCVLLLRVCLLNKGTKVAGGDRRTRVQSVRVEATIESALVRSTFSCNEEPDQIVTC